MPLLQPRTHRDMTVALTPDSCTVCHGPCVERWFHTGFDTEFNGGQQGCYVLLNTGEWTYVPHNRDDLLTAGFADDHIFEVGRDGYYLTMQQARDAIPVVHGVHYVDDFNDEFQDFFICKDDADHTPYEEAHVEEPIR